MIPRFLSPLIILRIKYKLRNLSTRDCGLEVTGIVQTNAEESREKDRSNRNVENKRVENDDSSRNVLRLTKDNRISRIRGVAKLKLTSTTQLDNTKTKNLKLQSKRIRYNEE